MRGQFIGAQWPGHDDGTDDRQGPGAKRGMKVLRCESIGCQHDIARAQRAAASRQDMVCTVIAPTDHLAVRMQECTLPLGGSRQPERVAQRVQPERRPEYRRSGEVREIEILFCELIARKDLDIESERAHEVIRIMPDRIKRLLRAGDFEFGVTLHR